jgi:hypothetical protein
LRSAQPKNLIHTHDFDFALIQETFLEPTKNFKPPCFIVIRKDLSAGHEGGLMILIKRGIRFSEVNIKCDIEHQAIKFFPA